jgi:hypothetical protein
MPIARVTDHVEAGLDLLLDYYKGKPRLEALLSSELKQIQALEDAAWDVLIQRLIDNATGVQLDKLGRIVGQPRVEEDDEVYRVRIRTRVRANKSLGHPKDLIEVALILTGLDKTELEYSESYPAGFMIEVLAPMSAELASVLLGFLIAAKSPGVRPMVQFSELGAENAFTWADGDEFEDDEDRGFGGDDPDVGPGGIFVGEF